MKRIRMGKERKRHGARRDTVNRWEAINFGLECPIAPHFVQCKFTSDVDHLTGLPFVSFSLKTTRIPAVASHPSSMSPSNQPNLPILLFSTKIVVDRICLWSGWKKKKFIFLEKFTRLKRFFFSFSLSLSAFSEKLRKICLVKNRKDGDQLVLVEILLIVEFSIVWFRNETQGIV